MNSTINHWMITAGASGTTPESLMEDAKKYFMWCEANPIYKDEIVKQTGAQTKIEVPRPFNLPALCLHCGVTPQYINDCARNPQAGNFHLVAQWILQVIYAQNLEYAMVGIFNSVLTAKKLNLGVQEEAGKLAAIVNISVVQSENTPRLAENEIEKS